MSLRNYDIKIISGAYDVALDGGALGNIDLGVGVIQNTTLFVTLGLTTVNFASGGPATITFILFNSLTVISPAIPFGALTTTTPALFNFPFTTLADDTIGVTIGGAPLTAGKLVWEFVSTFIETNE